MYAFSNCIHIIVTWHTYSSSHLSSSIGSSLPTLFLKLSFNPSFYLVNTVTSNALCMTAIALWPPTCSHNQPFVINRFVEKKPFIPSFTQSPIRRVDQTFCSTAYTTRVRNNGFINKNIILNLI